MVRRILLSLIGTKLVFQGLQVRKTWTARVKEPARRKSHDTSDTASWSNLGRGEEIRLLGGLQ
jgi:hypothetical protein